LKAASFIENFIGSFNLDRNGKSVLLKFTGVSIENLDFFNFKDFNNLTLDTLYRGRVVDGNRVIEISNYNQGYFYLEFYEGPKLEFWANAVELITD